MAQLKDIQGQAFGRLIVLGRAPNPGRKKGRKRSEAWWECLCSCGTKKAFPGTNLRSGNSTSCGCLHRELLAEANVKSKTIDPWVADMRLYLRKLSKRRREGNPKRRLGSNQFVLIDDPSPLRTVTLAASWALSVENYKALVTAPCFYCGLDPQRPLPGRSDLKRNGIDRVDNVKGYTPENCVPCCTTCNRDKRERAQIEFIAHTQRRYLWLLAKGLITTCSPALASSA